MTLLAMATETARAPLVAYETVGAIAKAMDHHASNSAVQRAGIRCLKELCQAEGTALQLPQRVRGCVGVASSVAHKACWLLCASCCAR